MPLVHNTLRLCPYRFPNPDELYNRIENQAYKKKSAGICTCHSSHASRPSHCPLSKNEQHRSPRRYVYNNLVYLTTRYTKGYNTPHADIYRCFVLWLRLKVAKFQCVKDKSRQVNVFLIYMSAHTLGVNDVKIQIYLENAISFPKIIDFRVQNTVLSIFSSK